MKIKVFLGIFGFQIRIKILFDVGKIIAGMYITSVHFYFSKMTNSLELSLLLLLLLLL